VQPSECAEATECADFIPEVVAEAAVHLIVKCFRKAGVVKTQAVGEPREIVDKRLDLDREWDGGRPFVWGEGEATQDANAIAGFFGPDNVIKPG